MAIQPKKQEQTPTVPHHTKGKQPDQDNQVRHILACASVALAIANTIAYAVTREPILLGTSTATGTVIILVFVYYFKK